MNNNTESGSIEDPPDISLENAQLLGHDLPEPPPNRPASSASDQPTITPSSSTIDNALSNASEAEECETAQDTSPEESPPVKWIMGWRYPTLMAALFLIGTLVAIAHHVYYQSLENTLVRSSSQQTWAIRIGTGLAFLNKTCLTTVMGMITTQQIWFTVRRRFVTLRGIDSMFKLMNDPTAIFNRDLITRAKALVLMASFAWLIPLIAVVTPATLSVRTSMETAIIPTQVSIVDFGNDSSWGALGGNNLVASPDIGRLFAATYSSISNLPMAAPFPNSSYELSFWAPAYKCSSLHDFMTQLKLFPTWNSTEAEPSQSIQEAWGNMTAPTERIGQTFTYSADAPSSEFVPLENNNMILIWTSGINSRAGNSLNHTEIVCQLYNTSYEVSVRFDNGVQSILPLNISYLHPQEWRERFYEGIFTWHELAVSSWIIHELFKDFLSGKVTIGAKSDLMSTVPLLQSGLVSCPEIWNSSAFQGSSFFDKISSFGNCRNQTLAEAIEDLSRNFTYSAIAFLQANSLLNAIVPIAVTAPHNLYSYEKTTLLATYAAGIFTVLLWMGIGGIALWSNGIASSTSFSSILLTTRNPDLDSLAKGYSLGSDTLPAKIADVRLKFGRVGSERLAEHAAFGIDGTVTTLQKGDIVF